MSTSTETSAMLATSGAYDVEGLISLGLYALIATGLILLLLLLARFLGQRTHSDAKDAPYESAVEPTGDARLREPVPFYLVAIFLSFLTWRRFLSFPGLLLMTCSAGQVSGRYASLSLFSF